MSNGQVLALIVLFVAAEAYAILLGRYLRSSSRWTPRRTAIAAAVFCVLGTLLPIIFMGPKAGLVALGFVGFVFVWPAFVVATRLLGGIKA